MDEAVIMPYDLGEGAYREGKSRDCNPYASEPERSEWFGGYDDAMSGDSLFDEQEEE